MSAPPFDAESSERDTPVPDSPSERHPVAVAAAPPPPREDVGRVVAALRRFLASADPDKGPAFIERAVIRKIYGRHPIAVDPELVAEVVQDAAVEALKANSPPWTVFGIPGWVTRVSQRAAFAAFRAQKDDLVELRADVDVVELPGRSAYPATDQRARVHLIMKFIESRIGDDAAKMQTFRLLVRKEIDGESLADLAAAERTTPAALSMRFHKLREELTPQLTWMEEEKPRRAFFLFLLWIGAPLLVIGIVLLVWYLLRPTSTPVPVQIVPVTPATVVQPEFDQALPPPPTAPSSSAESAPPRIPDSQRKLPPPNSKR